MHPQLHRMRHQSPSAKVSSLRQMPQLDYLQSLECLNVADGASLAEVQAAFVSSGLRAHGEEPHGRPAEKAAGTVHQGLPQGSELEDSDASQCCRIGSTRTYSFSEVLHAYELLAALALGCGNAQHVVGKPQRLQNPQAAATAGVEAFWSNICNLLRQLTPECRREVLVSRFSEADRRGLELWMRAARASKEGSVVKESTLSERSLCKFVGRGRRVGYRPIMHLRDGFYLQSSFTWDLSTALGSLGILVAIRASCRDLQLSGRRTQGGLQEVIPTHGTSTTLSAGAQLIYAAVHRVLTSCSCEGRQFYFKTRLKVHGTELGTPMQVDLACALHDWQQLHSMRHAIRKGIVQLPSPKRRCTLYSTALTLQRGHAGERLSTSRAIEPNAHCEIDAQSKVLKQIDRLLKRRHHGNPKKTQNLMRKKKLAKVST